MNEKNFLAAGAPPVAVPPAMQALVIIAKLNPQPGDSGAIDCPKCGKHTFNWWKERAIGKLSGACTDCGLRLPRA